MQTTTLYKNLLQSNLEIDANDPISRKLVLLNILLYVSGAILVFFVLYNLEQKAYLIAFIDFMIASAIIYSVLDVRKTANIKSASLISTASVFILMLSLVYFVKGEDFTLIWTVFLPIFAIFINGSRLGLLITAIFYTTIFTIAYQGLGVWLDGAWTSASFARLIMASLGLTLITYFFEQSLENAHTALMHSKKLEKQYVQTLEQCSITDPLTALYNRRHLSAKFDEKFAQAKEKGSYFSLTILDIDRFKEYNDTYGHQAGDEALIALATSLKESLRRESDSVFRLGGEEFCILLSADEHKKIAQSLTRVKEKIAELTIEHKKSEHKILTASFGVSIIHEYEDMNFEKMYKEADINLYKAKESGRNTIVGLEISKV